MNLVQALKTLGELKPVFEILAPANGDLRWNLLQDWLRKNPKYRKQLLHCLSINPSEAFDYLCQQFDLDLKGIAMADPSGIIRGKVESAIGQLQELYKDRAASNFELLPTNSGWQR